MLKSHLLLQTFMILIIPLSSQFTVILDMGSIKKLEKDAVLFIPAHNTISLSFGSKRSQTLAYEDFIDNKSKFISEDSLISNRPKVDKYLIINLDVKAYDLVNIFLY